MGQTLGVVVTGKDVGFDACDAGDPGSVAVLVSDRAGGNERVIAMALSLEQLRQRRAEIVRLAEQFGARNVRVFGSVARGQQRDISDIDILVKFDRGRSLFDLIGLKQDLEDLLGCEVDVISEGGLHPDADQRILQEAVSL